ncbi:MAG TPA: hypothetical protein VFE53_15605 [Mucilaginibacter sp.]|jgi:hypothetical protein|nr:hypothetical protein [Mucilaginibacter sp.]
MKKIALLLALLSFLNVAGHAQATTSHPTKKDTSRSAKSKKKPAVVKGREARRRLQQQQIKQHKKQLKEVDSVQKELDKELHKTQQQKPSSP